MATASGAARASWGMDRWNLTRVPPFPYCFFFRRLKLKQRGEALDVVRRGSPMAKRLENGVYDYCIFGHSFRIVNTKTPKGKSTGYWLVHELQADGSLGEASKRVYLLTHAKRLARQLAMEKNDRDTRGREYASLAQAILCGDASAVQALIDRTQEDNLGHVPPLARIMDVYKAGVTFRWVGEDGLDYLPVWFTQALVQLVTCSVRLV